MLDVYSRGPGSSNPPNLDLRRVPRPILSLDADMQWQVE
jgi:hypothetical protein